MQEDYSEKEPERERERVFWTRLKTKDIFSITLSPRREVPVSISFTQEVLSIENLSSRYKIIQRDVGSLNLN